MAGDKNVVAEVVRDFGREWERFDQTELSDNERQKAFDQYFAVFPWSTLSVEAEGFDAGCGTGRWARLVAGRVRQLHCIDPSTAIDVARRNLNDLGNCVFHNTTIDAVPLPDASMDFGYSLGVLHHMPDTAEGLRSCVKKLRPGAPFLVYLYYAFDNQPWWFRVAWRASDVLRRVVSRLPSPVKLAVTELLAATVYFPLACAAKWLERFGIDVHSFPLSAYRNRSFYTMRTDALDRFGTRLEQRFTKDQIRNMMVSAGLERIEFSSEAPFWCAVGYRQSS